jgi:hypothetical protein
LESSWRFLRHARGRKTRQELMRITGPWKMPRRARICRFIRSFPLRDRRN